jgi:hypothetical protein
LEHKTVLATCQNLQELEKLVEKIAQPLPAGQSVPERLTEVKGQLYKETKLSYQEFMENTTDPLPVEALQNALEEGILKDQILKDVKEKIQKHDKKIEVVVERFRSIYSRLGELSQEYLAFQKKRKTEEKRDDSKPKLLPPEQRKEIGETIRSCFQMASCEFIARSSIFRKQNEKFFLGNYLISKVWVQKEDTFYLLLYALAPEEQLGNRLLKRGDLFWFYNKREDSLQRVTPTLLRFTPNEQLQHTMDIILLTHLEHYELEEGVEEVVLNGEKLHRFCFVSKESKNLPVLYCIYSMSKKAPMKLEYCTSDGTPQIAIYCRSFQPTFMGVRIRKYVMQHLSTPLMLMQMEYLHIAAQSLPSYRFHKDQITTLKIEK